MACGGTTGAVQKRLNAVTIGGEIEWFTGFMSCIGMDTVFAVMKAKAAGSNFFEARIVVQTADVRPSEPNDPATKGTTQTPTSGSFEYGVSIDISDITADAAFIRFGVEYEFAVGEVPVGADVELEVSFVQCGQMAGSATHQLSATTTLQQIVAITDFMPGILVQKAKAIAICRSLTGDFQWQLAYRLAATSKENPGAWNTLGSAQVAGEINTGDITVTVGTNMWVQFGIMYNLSGGTSGQATLSSAIGVRRT